MITRQTITYWRPTGDVSVPYGAPQQLEAEVQDMEDGQRGVALKEAVQERGFLYLGAACEMDPRLLQDSCEIVEVARMPCLRTLTQRYVAFIN